ncbi:zinc finger protein 485-like [Latimeria chalumnae]|uniref:zinc finger protein 485-like n=1 Tax=Latimeria chalumnae TaxID=7897 RepID=UPI00313B9ADF
MDTLLKEQWTDVLHLKAEPVWENTSASIPVEIRAIETNPDQFELETTFKDIEMYFTKDEWTGLQDWEKEVYMTIKEHYDTIISFGYPFPKPDFMTEVKENHQLSVCDSTQSKEDDSPIQCEINIDNHSNESPLSISSDVQPSHANTVMEQSGGKKNTENAQQCRVQACEEMKSIQSNEENFNHHFECNENLCSLEKCNWHLETHQKEYNPCTVSTENSNQLIHVLPHQDETCNQQECVKEKMDSIHQLIQSEMKQHNCTGGQKQVHPEDKPHQCTECGKSFSDLLSPTEHYRIHTGEKPHQCTECGKNFIQSFCHQTHKGKPYKCIECGKSYDRLSTLYNHKQIHIGEKPHKCTECGKSFRDLSSLKTHQQIHTGVKPYKCIECGKSFTRIATLYNHQRIHTRKKTCKPMNNGKSFTQSLNLKTHQKSHKGKKSYNYTERGKSFSKPSFLKSHQRIHTGKKLYKCTECGKSFRNSSALKIHQRIHKGKKPCKCTECGKNFRKSLILKTHLLIHKTEKSYKYMAGGRRLTRSFCSQMHQKIHTEEKPYKCTECGKS